MRRLREVLSTGGADAEHVVDRPPFPAALEAYAEENGQAVAAVREEAVGYLDEMLATHDDRVSRQWNRFGKWMLRAHDVVADEDHLSELRAVDRRHSLAFVFSHRSYLDGFVLPLALASRRFQPTYTFGGANLDLPVLGQIASRTGVLFIRRATKDVPLYRLMLRTYIAHLVSSKSNLAWSIEGGRTRTGKLRPPTHGILKYLADAAETTTGPDVLIVPVSIVYDQLHEVPRMTNEARGSAKRPEDFAWLLSLAKAQRQRLGRAYLTFGEPIALRERIAALEAAGVEESAVVGRIALDTSHRINRATPVTVTAVVCLALLGADRALTFEEVLATVTPLADYIDARKWAVAGGGTLTDRSTVRRALHELVASGVLDTYESGTDPIWRVAEHQHLVAAFYRNTVIHILVERSIAEVAMVEAASPGPDAANATGLNVLVGAWQRSLRLRDLLKFEFFFSDRRQFEADLRAEVAILAPNVPDEVNAEGVRTLLENAPVYLAPLVLRPYIDAYLVFADRLASLGGEAIDAAGRDALLTEALHLGEQWVLQRRIASAESVSLEILRNAWSLAENRGLLSAEAQAGEAHPNAGGLAAARRAFRDELAGVARSLTRLTALADARSRGTLDRRGDGAAG